jgi:hypothetical protein
MLAASHANRAATRQTITVHAPLLFLLTIISRTKAGNGKSGHENDSLVMLQDKVSYSSKGQIDHAIIWLPSPSHNSLSRHSHTICANAASQALAGDGGRCSLHNHHRPKPQHQGPGQAEERSKVDVTC